jgi:CNT family concentrative nucleoside transporter
LATPLIDIKFNEFTSDDDHVKVAIGKRSLQKILIDLAIWVLLTAYITALIIIGKNKQGYIMAIIVYCFISLRLLARHISMSELIYKPLGFAFKNTAGKMVEMIPRHLRIPALFIIFIIAMLVTAICAPIDPVYSSIPSRIQSFSGVIVIILLMAATSKDRNSIPWHTVAVGLLAQYIIALFVLKTSTGVNIVQFLSNLITDFLETSTAGMEFLIGSYAHNNFAANVLPAIIFFCAFISVVYYFGGMQYIVAKMAHFFMFVMDTSGSESVVAAASPFVGQGESALLVKPFVEYMTKSELHSTMTSGFATIAGILQFFIYFRFRSFGVHRRPERCNISLDCMCDVYSCFITSLKNEIPGK